MSNTKQTEERVNWYLASFKESLHTHWMHIGLFKGTPRFKVYCLKEDLKCFVEDLTTDTKIEYNGNKGLAEAYRIIDSILDKLISI